VVATAFSAGEVMGSIPVSVMLPDTDIEPRQVPECSPLVLNIENQAAWFLAELCKAEKGVQKDKENQRRTELFRGCLERRIFQ